MTKTSPLLQLLLSTLSTLLTLQIAHSFVPTQRESLSNPRQALKMSPAPSQDDVPTLAEEKFKAIIFDIDGTLADSWKLGFDATLKVLENNDIPTISSETYHECTRYATPDRLARHAGLEPGHPDYEKVGERLGMEFDNLYVGLVDTKTAGYFEGIDNLLGDIPLTIPLGALTNACVDYAYAVLKVNSPDEAVYQRFGSIKGADNVPAPKPAPDGLLQVCKELGVEPSDCVYVGDSPSDGGAAENAGMPSIGVLWGSHSEESLKNAPFSTLCRTVDELRSALHLV